ncbi:MAG: methionyl-tRNA formyltransferase, partial [Verrucomicrobiota bacterium]
MITPARTIFMGTGELACATLSALAQSPFISLLVAVSQPDKPKGRELKLQPTPVKTEAAKWNVPVLQPNRARDPEFIERLREL